MNISTVTDKFKKVTSKDIDLVNFVIDNGANYNRWEIFYRAQKEVESLKRTNVLDLYLRYHRFLYPLLTGQPSNECEGLYESGREKKKEEKVTVGYEATETKKTASEETETKKRKIESESTRRHETSFVSRQNPPPSNQNNTSRGHQLQSVSA